MIVYRASKANFVQETDELGIEYRIAQAYLQRTGRYAPDAEMRAWTNGVRFTSIETQPDPVFAISPL